MPPARRGFRWSSGPPVRRKALRGGDTLYFNAFTEDLFSWDNDLDADQSRVLRLNPNSTFFSGMKGLALEDRIKSRLNRYADLNFTIDYDNWSVSFQRGNADNIKVSRSEENLFIWCLFMAICELVIDSHSSYNWVRYLFIDDPISSMDDNSAIAVATDLATLLRSAKGRMQPGSAAAGSAIASPIKAVVTSHHALFFNVLYNELKHKNKLKSYFLHRPGGGSDYILRRTGDTPFFHHLAMLSELCEAADADALSPHHFNVLRSIMEKTAAFLGKENFSACINGIDDDVLFTRALNLLSHGGYSLYDSREMVEDNKQLFKSVLNGFLGKHGFDISKALGTAAVARASEKQEPAQ